MKGIKFHYVFLLFVVSLCLSCATSDSLQIVIGNKASHLEQITAQDLQEDLNKVLDTEVAIVTENEADKNSRQIILGTPGSNESLSKSLAQTNSKFSESYPGERGGVWHKVNENQIVIAGSDVQGLQYAVYDYSKIILDIDPLIYWSGHTIDAKTTDQVFSVENKVIDPPHVPLLVYFDNDADELMNLHEPLLTYDWESYTEMIDALVRMRYNGFKLFDALGRPEFFRRESYKAIVPDYQLDIAYVDSMINYAHLKGMKVQVDLSMGYQFKSLESEFADCWSSHKDKWVDVWKYYLEKTPIGKADIFSLRPRNQVWDWEYKSTCGESKIEVFEEVYSVLGKVIDEHNPQATKVAICYSDGMQMYNEGFRPPSDWIIAWSDDGYAEFEYLPETTEGYDFGTYMHAGYWKNHTVLHPYPHVIDTSMHMMFNDYNASKYCMVNGQQFRPFIINIEAFSEVCREPKTFTGDEYYNTWLKRYFPDSTHADVLKLMRGWESNSFGKEGYVENLWQIREVISYLSEQPIVRPGKTPVPFSRERVDNDLKNTNLRFKNFKYYNHLCKLIESRIDPSSAVFYDQIQWPIQLHLDLLAFEGVLHEMYRIKCNYERERNPNLPKQANALWNRAKLRLDELYSNRLKNTKDPKWNGWYDPSKRRPNNGFPTQEMMNDIKVAIDTKW